MVTHTHTNTHTGDEKRVIWRGDGHVRWVAFSPMQTVCLLSAAGASEPKNMIYMSRLGIWGEGTPFKTFDDFLHAIEKRYVGRWLPGVARDVSQIQKPPRVVVSQ